MKGKGTLFLIDLEAVSYMLAAVFTLLPDIQLAFRVRRMILNSYFYFCPILPEAGSSKTGSQSA